MDFARQWPYVIDQPVVQLEGLVMDAGYLNRIRNREPLVDAMRAYGTRYYIATNLDEIDGCVTASEPGRAGSRSPKMSVTICGEPVWADSYAGYDLRIYDLTAVDTSSPRR